MDAGRTTQLTLGLGRLFGQNVTLEGLAALDGSARTHTKALFGAAFRFHFWHDTQLSARTVSIFYMIAGGNTSLRLDACTHLFDSEIAFAAFENQGRRHCRRIWFCKIMAPRKAP
jgi:hypothetical protein